MYQKTRKASNNNLSLHHKKARLRNAIKLKAGRRKGINIRTEITERENKSNTE